MSLVRANGLCGMAGGAADNQIETTFLLNFHSLLKQGNYSLLTQAECECADGDGFLLDVECTVRAPPPSLSQNRAPTALLSPVRPASRTTAVPLLFFPTRSCNSLLNRVHFISSSS
jgi:hypothetical protein